MLGPSGVGKTTLIRRIVTFNQRFRPARQYVTRSLRPGETEKIQVSESKFLELQRGAKLIGVSSIFGMHTGTLVKSIRKTLATGGFPIFDWPISKLEEIAAAFPGFLYRVYVEPPSFEALASRLDDGRDPHNERLMAAKKELEALWGGDYDLRIDCRVVNEDGKAESVARTIYEHFIRSRIPWLRANTT
jgi:guanylate kinase